LTGTAIAVFIRDMFLPRRSLFALGSLTILVSVSLTGAEANYDEAKVPDYTLPDPLVMADGRPVTSASLWEEQRRPEVLSLFAEHVYGRTPDIKTKLAFELVSVEPAALEGKAIRKEVTVYLAGDRRGPSFDLLLYLPREASRPAPTFLGLNFGGNHTIEADPKIRLSQRWMRNRPDQGVVNHQATAASRGSASRRWPLAMILERGYALATIYCGDFEPDHAEGWKTGVRAAFSPNGANTRWKSDDWGCIGAWAWGLSRALDYLEGEEAVDGKRVGVIGHSRLGKTALWAGAQDERFAMVISNNSGEGGAALARRRFGETTAIINSAFPHWFCARFKEYNDHEDALPVDQHLLVALMAPRPVYVASAEEDRWADPRGEFLAAKHASPVYELLGLPGLGVVKMPAPHRPVGGRVGYHLRAGRHDITAYDWEQYLNFADRHWGKR
jgi:hypothetical protein